MMEVTSHIKSVLKNYQHSATKSLQGPGLTLVQPKNELPSPEIEKEEFVPASFPVQQVPILTTPDTSCSERTETILEGECISCFVVGGEKRLCLPQVLNSVLRDFTLLQINQQCDLLQIYCSRCTPEQLNVLKSHGILPCSAHSCGLITKTDAERLCSALLCGQRSSTILPPKTAVSFTIYHECFGKSGGLCFPELYTSKNAKCIECTNCRGGFTPQQFVCHVHDKPENRTVHWGFDSCNWRCYLHVPKDHIDHKQCEKYLDEMRDQFEGKLPFPPASETAIKRKQVATLIHLIHESAIMLASDLMKGRDIPLKKQKLDCLSNFNHMFLSSANVETIYLQYFQEYNTTNRHHMSAFKPFKDIQTIKELKTHKANALGINPRYTDPPILQNPERVISVTDTERFERTYQPNVALAPPTPKKHRYGKSTIVKEKKPENISPVQLSELDNPIVSSDVVLRVEDEHFRQASPEKFVDSTTVSVVVPPPSSNKYNPEIELSTDTEDSASETSEKHHSEFGKIEDALKTADVSVRERVLELFRNLSKEQERLLQDNREKDLKISELQQKNTELVIELEKSKELLYQCSNNRTNSQNNSECKKSVHDGSDVDTSSSIIKTKECNGTEHNAIITGGEPQTAQQKSVIASLDDIEQKAIIQTAPE